MTAIDTMRKISTLSHHIYSFWRVLYLWLECLSHNNVANVNAFYFQYPYEALFRSLQYALVDNSCREYLFTTDFFHVKAGHAQELFDRILGKTLSLLVVSKHMFLSLSSLLRIIRNLTYDFLFTEKCWKLCLGMLWLSCSLFMYSVNKQIQVDVS